ncbi:MULTISPECIES: aminoglycoside phosphotransferase family protein [unclassified Nocardiopsis]|uniref:aminoglycoside phosphotransferase family protein n=1 Tax=Nocardiopsis TaxID=2013 RepID=UPI00387B6B09
MVELGPYVVTKRFRPGDHGRCAREWRALTLLATHAPGVAPRPLTIDFDAAAPVVTMTRLYGEPLRGQVLDSVSTAALVETVAELHSAVPPGVLDRLSTRPGHQRNLCEFVYTWAPKARPGLGNHVARALDEGLTWLNGSALRDTTKANVQSVFGPGDGNLANYLWGGSRVRVVDFEESGRSDRAFELAEITEHVGSWVEYPLDVSVFLSRFALTPAESDRLQECRRLLALVWLLLLCRDAKGERRNPPGTTDRQARRLLILLT